MYKLGHYKPFERHCHIYVTKAYPVHRHKKIENTVNLLLGVGGRPMHLCSGVQKLNA